MEQLLKSLYAIGSFLLRLIATVFVWAVALLIIGPWASLLIWCLPLTLSAATVLIAFKLFGIQPGRKAGMIVAASAATSFHWARFILEPHLPGLPKWFLFVLAMHWIWKASRETVVVTSNPVLVWPIYVALLS